MAAKQKPARVSTYPNGKPRMRRSGGWSFMCVGDKRPFADIELMVHPEDVVNGKCSFRFRMPTAEHCEHIAEWLKQAAAFIRQKEAERTASRQDASERMEAGGTGNARTRTTSPLA